MYLDKKRKYVYNEFLKEFKEAKIKRDFQAMSELYTEMNRNNYNVSPSCLSITNYFTDISEKDTIELPVEVRKYLLSLGQLYTYFLTKNCIDIHLDTYFRDKYDLLPKDIITVKPYIVEHSLQLDALALNTLQLSKGNIVKIELFNDGIIIEKENEEYMYF